MDEAAGRYRAIGRTPVTKAGLAEPFHPNAPATAVAKARAFLAAE